MTDLLLPPQPAEPAEHARRAAASPPISLFAGETLVSNIQALVGPVVDLSVLKSDELLSACTGVVVVESRMEGSEAFLDALSKGAPETPTLVIGDNLPTGEVRALMRLPTSDILGADVPPEAMLSRAANLYDDTRTTDGSGAVCWAFVSGVGGAGVTTLAVETASVLVLRDPPKRVAIIDLNVTDGMTAAYLDGDRKLDIAEVCRAPERIDAALLSALSWRHASGLTLFAAPRDHTAEAVATDTGILSLLDVVCANFDHVILDVPRHRTAWTAPVFEAADEVMVVSELTIPSLHAAAHLAADIDIHRGGGSPARIILNRMVDGRGNRHSIPLDKAERAIGRDINATVASDWDAARAAVNLGMPVSEVTPKSPLVRDVNAFVDVFAPVDAKVERASAGGVWPWS